MKVTRLILIIIFALFVFQSSAQTSQIKFVKTLKDSLTLDSAFYNVFQYEKKFILLKDNKGYDATNDNAVDYIKLWGDTGKPVEADNFFLLDSELKKLKRADRKFLPKFGLEKAIFKSNSYLANRNEFMMAMADQDANFIAIVYECTTDHDGKPHSGTDETELKTKYGCTKFKAKIVSGH